MDKNSQGKIPYSVIHRLPKYLIHIQRLDKTQNQWISSHDLAQALSLTSSTVRQDLSYLEFSGISKKGYEIMNLENSLLKELNIGNTINLIIVGAGNLGRAVAQHNGFQDYNFKLCHIFDKDPVIIGQTIGHLVVEDIINLETINHTLPIDIGILTVPFNSAQEVANRLMAAGIKGILNFTPAHIVTNGQTRIIDSRILANLLELNCLIRFTG